MNEGRPAGSYGVDAPWVPWMWVGFAIAYAVLAVLNATVWGGDTWITVLVSVLAAVFLGCAGLYWYVTLRGKFAVWRELLAHLGNPDHVLDMGCGRGAVAIMEAQTFPGATIDAIDLWRSVDQSGNGVEAATRNAEANRVDDRITFATGDMTELPYPDGSFELVTASLSIHNIHSSQGRAQAVREAWRVLAPGGRLVIVDISKVPEYARTLGEHGVNGAKFGPAGWRMWWSGPWMSTRILVADKPAA